MSRRASFSSVPAASPYESGTWGTPENPCPSERTLAAHLDGELDAVRARAVDAHLDACMACASDSQRLENLSGCLQSWNRARGTVDPSPRLLGRVLREVGAEGRARWLETTSARRRIFVGAAAALALIGASAALGAATRHVSPADAPGAWSPPAHVAKAAPAFVVRPTPLAFGALTQPAADERSSGDGVGADIRARWNPKRADRAPFADAATKEAFAKWLPALGAQQRMGERVCVYDGRALLVAAIPVYERIREWSRWMSERAQIENDPGTRDPSDTGLAVADVMPLPSGKPPLSRDTVVVPATAQGGGLVLRALPRTPGRDVAATPPPAPPPAPPTVPTAPAVPRDPTRDPFSPEPTAKDPVASAGSSGPTMPAQPAGTPSDLASAVRGGRARLLPDVSVDRRSVGVEVMASDTPILVPAGELLRGGAGDRVVAEGTWLPGTGSGYVYWIPTRPIDRLAGRPGSVPEVLGLVAGPELRAVLARGEDSASVLELVHSQLRDAGLLGPESTEESRGEPSLLALYATDSDATLARARRLVKDLGDDAAGFVAADPNGRFQGFERVDVPGDAGRAVLARLVAGYLAEARVRSASDGARTGVQTTDVLGALSARPLRLAPPTGAASLTTFDATKPSSSLRGLEPRTGLLLQGVRSGVRTVPLLSGLVRDFAR